MKKQKNGQNSIIYKNLSLGTKQKLALIQAFIHKPKILILDEPFNALDKESLKKTEEYLASIKKDIILILSTHINDSVKYMCDYEYIFEDKNLKLKQKLIIQLYILKAVLFLLYVI